MINKVKITNFKSIKNADISLGSLNILCGENASGKTSIIHAMLIAAQKKQKDYSADGNIIKIGNLDELRTNSESGDMVITIEGEGYSKRVVVKKNKDVKLDRNYKLVIDGGKSRELSYEKTLFYLCSNRMGVMDTYSKGNYLFGPNGEAVIDFLYKEQDLQFSNEYMLSFNNQYKDTKVAENRNFIEHVRFWMEYITGETITINSVSKTNQYVLTFGSGTRSINTGSGYSFLLPIIIVCLGAILVGENKPTVILENPEIFLHPDAQQKLTEFFIFCKQYVQLIIETHSEHLLKNAIEKNEPNIQIFVVKNDIENNQGTIVEPITCSSFKTNPVAYSEVIYRAFGLPTPELHILLYGMCQAQYNANNNTDSSIRTFDNYLYRLGRVPLKEWKYLNRQNNITSYKTLPTFIRNKIDHPEGKDPQTNINYEYTEGEFIQSIEWLLSII